MGSGETTVGDTTLLWSGREDNRHQEGVALAVSKKVMSACVSCLLSARFKHSACHLAVIVAYAPTESADLAVKDQFYMQLETAVTDRKKNDLLVVLGGTLSIRTPVSRRSVDALQDRSRFNCS